MHRALRTFATFATGCLLAACSNTQSNAGGDTGGTAGIAGQAGASAGGSGGSTGGASGSGGSTGGASGSGGSTGGSAGASGSGGGAGAGGCPSGMREVPTGSTPFCIDETEVTRFQYAQFESTATPSQTGACASNTSFTPLAGWPAASGEAAHPVVGIDWCDAKAYCEWAGKRLCGKIGGGASSHGSAGNTEGQWYWACSKGGAQDYPYGTTYEPLRCNGTDYGQGKAIAVGLATNCIGGYTSIWDMSGNVREWIDACDGVKDECNARGGAYDSSNVALNCAAETSVARQTWGASIGFRCCKD